MSVTKVKILQHGLPEYSNLKLFSSRNWGSSVLVTELGGSYLVLDFGLGFSVVDK